MQSLRTEGAAKGAAATGEMGLGRKAPQPHPCQLSLRSSGTAAGTAPRVFFYTLRTEGVEKGSLAGRGRRRGDWGAKRPNPPLPVSLSRRGTAEGTASCLFSAPSEPVCVGNSSIVQSSVDGSRWVQIKGISRAGNRAVPVGSELGGPGRHRRISRMWPSQGGGEPTGG